MPTDDERVLVVDLAGVLFHFDHPYRRGRLAALLGRTDDDVEALFWASGFSHDCDAGVFGDAATVRDEIRTRAGRPDLTDDALDDAWCSAFTPDPECVAAVTAEQAGGRRCVLFTNNGPLEEEVLTRRHPQAITPFAAAVWCHRLPANKPDPAAYAALEELIGAAPAALVFVDDSEDNLAVARERGWGTRRFTGPAVLRV